MKCIFKSTMRLLWCSSRVSCIGFCWKGFTQHHITTTTWLRWKLSFDYRVFHAKMCSKKLSQQGFISAHSHLTTKILKLNTLYHYYNTSSSSLLRKVLNHIPRPKTIDWKSLFGRNCAAVTMMMLKRYSFCATSVSDSAQKPILLLVLYCLRSINKYVQFWKVGYTACRNFRISCCFHVTLRIRQ